MWYLLNKKHQYLGSDPDHPLRLDSNLPPSKTMPAQHMTLTEQRMLFEHPFFVAAASKPSQFSQKETYHA